MFFRFRVFVLAPHHLDIGPLERTLFGPHILPFFAMPASGRRSDRTPGLSLLKRNEAKSAARQTNASHSPDSKLKAAGVDVTWHRT